MSNVLQTTIRISELPTGTPDSTAVFPYVSMAETVATGPTGTTVNVTRQCVGADLTDTHVHDASDIPFTPSGDVASTDVQSALVELDTDKLPKSGYTAADVLAKLITVDGTGSTLDADLLDGNEATAFALSGHNHDGVYQPVGNYVTADTYTASDVLSKLETVDGAGSGLDADLLDGNEAAAFAISGHNHSGVYAAASHASQHKSSGGDTIKLDELAAPTDVITLNASSSAHGLLPKLANTGSKYLRDDGTWQTVSGSSLADGDKGDITVSNSGGTWTIDSTAVTYSKIQNVTATDKVLGRVTTGAGTIEEIACTAAGRALLDDADAATQRSTLGLGSAATAASGDFATSGHNHSGVYQPVDADLTALAGLSGTGGYAKRTAADTWTIATPSYGDVGAAAAGHDHAGVYQPVDADLTALSGLSGTGGYAKRTAADTWTIATPSAADVGAVGTDIFTDMLDPTGFVNPAGITVSYDSSARTITLTGNLAYYWRGVKHTLTSPWTSSAHGTGDNTFFLSSSNGTTFTWGNSVWEFSDLQVAYAIVANSGALKIGFRECHGLMPWQAHEILHANVGTYLESGGLLDGNTYTVNTANNTATTPGLFAALIHDEDLETTIAAWPEGTYTTMRIGSSNSVVFDTAASYPFRESGSYILVNTPSTGGEAAAANSRYVNVYTIMMPTAADADSQKYRVLWLQPQAAYTSLAAALAEDPRTLALGTLAALSPEFTITSRITYLTGAADTNAGKCRIATGGVTYLAGGRYTLTSVSGITAVTANNVGINPIPGLSATNVQEALEELLSLIG